MTGRFDDAGDLWVPVQAGYTSSLPLGIMSGFATSAPGPVPGTYTSVTEINLTAYIRGLMRPDWVNAALTSSSANVTVGQKLSDQQMQDWLATIPQPIEPGPKAA